MPRALRWHLDKQERSVTCTCRIPELSFIFRFPPTGTGISRDPAMNASEIRLHVTRPYLEDLCRSVNIDRGTAQINPNYASALNPKP